MSKCCGDSNAGATGANAPCEAFGWFGDMVSHCLDYATKAKAAGRPVVGIMCEYTPRELILAAGGVPACLCGGSAEMVGPAEEQLPANLCPLIKSTYGYHRQKANPFLEMTDLIVAETTCDGKKKMYELMGRTRRMHVLELPQKPRAPEAMAHWKLEVRKLKEALEELFSVEITDAKLREAIELMNRERSLKRGLAELMQADAPPLTGRQLLDFNSIIACMPTALEHYQLAIEQMTGQTGPAEYADRVRVMMTGVPVPHGAHRVLDIIEDSGGLVVAMENCSGIKPIYEDVDADSGDPLAAIAEKYFHLPCSVMTPNDSRMELLTRLAGEYRPDCIIELIWQACLTYDVESARVGELAGELGIPYLRIETDYSPSDSARVAVRVEALFETVRSRTGGPAR
ncbi:MAG: double-cubane-cluster-containing anaerobic reductase [Phycisphaerae bacterium]|jgi:benzoyl-CoA reductase/2-hydroxyglutaryl-CoA dehydratase subunit BcrC/BadD/HgdB|nr:double-cubane-cluster-containing anaerobic reductase [Phycisphaerae bacterium]